MSINKLQLKRSAVVGKIPTTASLDLGELAINTVDGKIYFKQQDTGSVQRILELTTTSGSHQSASYAATSSFAQNFTVAGTITAQQLIVQTISSSIIYSSGSNIFGDASNDNQIFTGSVLISGSITVSGSVTNNLTASYAINSNLLDGLDSTQFVQTGSFQNYTSSLNLFSASINSYTSSNNATISDILIETASINRVTASLQLFTASIFSYTASNNANITALNAQTASILSYTSSLNAKTGSFATTGSNIFTADQTIQGTLTVTKIVVQTITASQQYSSGSNIFGNKATDTQQFTGSVLVSGSITVSGSVINNLTSSFAVSASQALTASFILASGVVGLNLSQIASGSATASINPQTGLNVNIKTSVSGTLNVSESINAYNINAGNPTSNPWQTSLNGSYFNNFTTQTDVSEILRFIAGLLSASAPDAAPNTKTYNNYTANAQNTTTGTVTAGSIPQTSTNLTVQYLNSKGFATAGATIFSGITPIYTLGNYGYTYTSVAAGSTTVSSSNDAQLFGLGLLSSGTPTNFKVSGSFTFRFKDNSSKIDTATSSSNTLVTQTGAGTTSGVTLAKINTSNPAVIPAAYQDGKYATVFSNTIFSGSAAAVSQSGYYHISASIQIASGSSAYTVPVASNAEIFFAPLATISTNIPAQTPVTGSTTLAALTAVSRSLSGAPYLSGSTYILSSSFTNLFNPLYFAGAGISTLSTVATGMTQTSGVTTVSTAGGTIQTANAVFDSTGTTLRATSTVPFETDIIKLNGLYTFGSANITNIAQTAFTPTTFTISIAGVNKNAGTTTYTTSSNYHTGGTFGQPALSGALAYYTRTQGTDSGTNSGASNLEPFTGESNRILLNDSILSFTGTTWNTAYVLGNLSGSDLQVKPGFLVKPGGTYGYWITDPDTTKTNKYYVRRFTTNGTTKTSMTLNAGVVFNDWQVTGSNAAGVLILFQSSNSSIYTPARFYDPTKTTSNFVTNITANTDGQNPFGSQIALYGNSGGSLASTTYTIPIRNADGMFLNATYTNIYVIIRYKGDPTPLTSMTVTFA
jgi:hypothetical protein